MVDGGGFNAINRGVYISDNLPFLRSLNDECIDLVCIDPPFAKNDTFVKDDDRLRPPLTEDELSTERRLMQHWGIGDPKSADEAGVAHPEVVKAGFKDIWSWSNDVHEEWIDSIERDYAGLSKLIDATRHVHGDGTAAYLCYMAVRLIEIHRVLKPTGSLYLHCDHTANGYIRQLLDGVFGPDNFRNEIIWHYNKWTNTANCYQQNHDTIFWFVKTQRAPYFKQYGAPTARMERLRRTGYNTGSSDGKKILRVYDRVKAREQIRKAEAEGRTVYYVDTPLEGVRMPDVWDISVLNGQSKERTGYSTQKPWVLAKRIIEGSTRPNDVVLDCFAGCAYAAIAAEKTDRRWVACDINPRSWTVVKRQFAKPQLVQLRCEDTVTGQQVMSSEPVVTVHGPGELPVRTSADSIAQPQDFELPERKFKVPASIIPEREMLERLLQISDYKAWCCGFANRRPNGDVVRTSRNFHLDHIDPKSKQGSNDILNRAPMCPAHNTRKGNRRVHLDDYRKEIAESGELMVDKMGDLVQLPDIRREVEGIYARAYAKKYPIPSAFP